MSGLGLATTMLHDIGQFFDHDMPIDEVAFVSAGMVPWVALRGMQHAFSPWSKKIGFGYCRKACTSAF